LLNNEYGVRRQAERDAALDSLIDKMPKHPKRRRCRRTPNFFLSPGA
jgi:hypothetical protein